MAKIKELTGMALRHSEMRRFMHEMGMKPLKTGSVLVKVGLARQQLLLGDKLPPLLAKAMAGECRLLFSRLADQYG